MRRLVRGDLVCALQCARNCVEAVDECLLRMRIEVERDAKPGGMRDDETFEVDRQLVLAQRPRL